MGTSAGFVPAAVPECPYAPRMTRAAALALRAAAGLRENCVVVITDGPVIGTAGNTSPTEIELNPTGPSELGLTARVHTTFAASAWAGIYDIDLGTAGSITELTDDFGNTAKDQDADAPTVHTQFPWHLGSLTLLRDNYAEDSVLTGWDTQVGFVGGNRVVASTVNLTAKTSGVVNESEFLGTNVVCGTSFSATRSTINGGTATLDGTGAVSLTRSRLIGSTLVQGAAATGGISVTDSDLNAAILTVDPASAKAITVSQSELLGYSIRTQDATAGTASLFRCNAFGKPNAATADSLLVHGTGGAGGMSINSSTVDGFSAAGAGQGSIDVNAPQSGALIQDADIQNSRITVGPGAGAFQTTGAEFDSAFINALGPGPAGRLTINQTSVRNGTITHGLLATDSLQVNSGRVAGGGLVELLSGARGLIVTNTDVLGASIIRQTTVNASSVPNINQVNDCRVIDLGRIIFSETIAAGQAASSVNRSLIKGSSLGGGVDGVLTLTGLSASVLMDSLECLGVITLTDVPSGALSAGTSFHDLRVGPVSVLTYTAGDATAKQIRNITVEDLSTLTLSALTGAAGGGLADVFAGVVRGQSLMTVTGARVVGQPVRNFTVDNGSTLNVQAAGTVLQCAFRNGATLNTAGFRHSESVIEGAITVTATAANVFRLANKAFTDWV